MAYQIIYRLVSTGTTQGPLDIPRIPHETHITSIIFWRRRLLPFGAEGSRRLHRKYDAGYPRRPTKNLRFFASFDAFHQAHTELMTVTNGQMRRIHSAGRYAFHFLGCVDFKIFNGWWALRFCHLHETSSDLPCVTPRPKNASSDGEPCIPYS